MANKTIPQLPEQTGKTDNDLLAIVDSGETTTSKIKVSTLLSGLGSPFIAADGTNNVVPDYYATTAIDSSSSENAIIGGSSNQITTNVNNAAVIGGSTNSITNRFDNAIVAGNGNSNAARYGVVVGGQNNQLQNGSQRGVIVGGINNTLNEGLQSAIIGGNNGDINLTWNSVNIAPFNSGIYHDQSHGQDEGFGLYNAPNSYIRQTAGSGTAAFKGGNASIFNSWTCDIAGQTGNVTKFATIIGSESSQITGGTRGTVLIGCSGRTGLNSHTTYVETLEAFTHIVLNDYSNLNFTSDANAATGGVPLGGLYHNAGDLKVRIT